jgi:UTP--glucose-1-phosphate uridylyltransferase
MKLRKAVIPVAGLGTRFLPATKTVPKELLPIVDIPSIQYVVQEAVDAGIEEIIFVTAEKAVGIGPCGSLCPRSRRQRALCRHARG